MVRYDKLHIGNPVPREYVPFIGDIMTARWAYEALAVKQFRDNGYEKNFFPIMAKDAEFKYYCNMVDAMTIDIFNYRKAERTHDEYVNSAEILARLAKSSEKLGSIAGIASAGWKDSLKIDRFTKTAEKGLKLYLDSIKKHFLAENTKVLHQKDVEEASLNKALGNDGRIKLREDNENERLKEEVLGEFKTDALVLRIGDRFVQNTNFGYMKGTSPYGRSHFYASVKMIGSKEINTFWFNIIVVWIESVLLYLALCFNLFRKGITWIGNIRVRKKETPQ
jgi:hypothetical protein